MRYDDLPPHLKEEVLYNVVDGFNEIEENNDSDFRYPCDDTIPAIREYLDEQEYEIERGFYEPGVPYERVWKSDKY